MSQSHCELRLIDAIPPLGERLAGGGIMKTIRYASISRTTRARRRSFLAILTIASLVSDARDFTTTPSTLISNVSMASFIIHLASAYFSRKMIPYARFLGFADTTRNGVSNTDQRINFVKRMEKRVTEKQRDVYRANYKRQHTGHARNCNSHARQRCFHGARQE